MSAEDVEESAAVSLCQEGLVDMDFGVLVWVAGVGMRPFTRALCEKIGKAWVHLVQRTVPDPKS
jgi:hypothetical protein